MREREPEEGVGGGGVGAGKDYSPPWRRPWIWTALSKNKDPRPDENCCHELPFVYMYDSLHFLG